MDPLLLAALVAVCTIAVLFSDVSVALGLLIAGFFLPPVAVILLFIFPGFATWLPDHVMGSAV